VPDTNKEDSKLDGNRELRDVGLVVEDVVILNRLHEAVENDRRDAQFFSESAWMIVSKASQIQVYLT
jgi:hypothetical protein